LHVLDVFDYAHDVVESTSFGDLVSALLAALGLLLVEPFVLRWALFAGWFAGWVAVGALLSLFWLFYFPACFVVAWCERFLRALSADAPGQESNFRHPRH
jgi:hypothetical protein